MNSVVFRDATVIDGSGRSAVCVTARVDGNLIGSITTAGAVPGAHRSHHGYRSAIRPGRRRDRRLPRRHADARPDRASRASVIRPSGDAVRLHRDSRSRSTCSPTLKHAKLYLDQGSTSRSQRRRHEAATRHRRARRDRVAATHPGPGCAPPACSSTVTGGVGDLRQLHLDPGEAMYTLPCDGPVEFRAPPAEGAAKASTCSDRCRQATCRRLPCLRRAR